MTKFGARQPLDGDCDLMCDTEGKQKTKEKSVERLK